MKTARFELSHLNHMLLILSLMFFNLTKSSSMLNNLFDYSYKRQVLSSISNRNIQYEQNTRRYLNNYYSNHDLYLVQSFVENLKKSNGQWGKQGIQRLIRLNSECSNGYLSLRNTRIKADIPFEEAFKDPYTLIEQQIYRKFTALKSKQLNKYVCFIKHTGYFVLKPVDQIDQNCIFIYSTIRPNTFQFSIGTNKTISISFGKYGKMINQNLSLKRKSQLECSSQSIGSNKSILFNLHTKLTDYVITNHHLKSIFNSNHKYNQINSIYYHSTLRRQFSSSTSTTTTTTTTTTTKRKFKRKFGRKMNNDVVLNLKREKNVSKFNLNQKK